MDGANQLDEMTTHRDFSTELVLHFFSYYKIQILLFLCSPPPYVYLLVFLGFSLVQKQKYRAVIKIKVDVP